MSYLYNIFTNNIDKNDVKIIFELGSQTLLDAFKLYNYYKCPIHSFECDPNGLKECNKNLLNANDEIKKNVTLIEKAVSLTDDNIIFYPFNLELYNNSGASSLYKIDFSLRSKNDPDYNRPNPQNEIIVKGIRLDTYMNQNNISNIDLLCIDLQGYELNALKSLGDKINNVKYIITECSINSTYVGGCSFIELNNYLNEFNFIYCCSDDYKYNFPNLKITGFSEFNALFINNEIL
jgi:FkbM family methyltransferase